MELPTQRPGSIRSVASNSSIASGVSLSRRPRTRARSKTVTGVSPFAEDVPQIPEASNLPYLAGPIVQEPFEEQTSSSQSPSDLAPVRPPRSPQRPEAVEIRSSDTASSEEVTAADASIVEPLQSQYDLLGGKQSKAAKLASNLPLLDTGYRPPPSAFSRDPALTPVNNVRDSVSTQQSGTSSSLYPPSTSTASGLESPTSPLSMADHIDELILPSFVPEINEVQEYDSDDVSYRLRLLVKNNYFLPPAHSKPSLEEFASSSLNAAKKTSRSTTPTFLDLFRVGKSKSKPTTPTGPSSFDPSAPMLRTTSDSIAASYALRTQQPRSSSQMPRLSPHLPNASSRGRVVVVREKMNDIVVAAKQAEMDLKSRGVRIDQGSQKAKQEVIDDIIDPTDAVDIPLPSPLYPFAVQASALHGLGVLDSLGAAVLAERLPPIKNPNMSVSYDATEDSWRKALLHEAVHHSLDNTPDVSTFSHILGASTPLSSPRSKGADTPLRIDPALATKRMIEQKIVAQPMIEAAESTYSTQDRRKSAQSQASTSKGNTKNNLSILSPNPAHDAARPPSYLPERVDTPSGPMTPLGPPPRRHAVNPLYSLSQTDLPTGQQPYSARPTSQDSFHALRRTVSSPLLAEGYDSFSSRHESMIASPISPATMRFPRDSQATITSFDNVRGRYDTANGPTSEVHGTESENHSRTSLALSAMRSRPSLSEYSQESMSPTTSTFQDMLNHEDHYSSSAGPSRFSIEQQNSVRAGSSPRYSTMSPPPRMSSSLAHVALPPPPRSSSLHYTGGGRPQMPPSGTFPHPLHIDSQGSTMRLVAPEPTTPPFPFSDRHSNPPSPPLSPTLSSLNVPNAIHSAPGPSSPTSFFDSIQTQPNAMDDLESSSDESDDEEEDSSQQNQPKLFIDPRTRAISSVSAGPRPSIMRLGNFSTPYLRPGETYRPNLLPIGNNFHPKQPIGNSPIRSHFFSDRKPDGLPSSSYDFFKYAQEHPPAAIFVQQASGESSDTRRPATADHVTAWRNNQKAQESLRKLDGMLLQHMEDEKDTIKRIATTLKQTAHSQPSNGLR
ncbi:hypothetical protein B0H34DRAFT_801992 [Crassisporium funariophilum]|nr:hypothetical protein B0H34DRAFT_801992 [Crassisporium funariophilum]